MAWNTCLHIFHYFFLYPFVKLLRFLGPLEIIISWFGTCCCFDDPFQTGPESNQFQWVIDEIEPSSGNAKVSFMWHHQLTGTIRGLKSQKMKYLKTLFYCVCQNPYTSYFIFLKFGIKGSSGFKITRNTVNPPSLELLLFNSWDKVQLIHNIGEYKCLEVIFFCPFWRTIA